MESVEEINKERTVERGISFQEVQDGHYLGQNSPKPVGKAEDDKIDDAMMDNKDTAQGMNLLEPPKDLKGGGNGSGRGCREGGRGSGHHHTGSRSNVNFVFTTIIAQHSKLQHKHANVFSRWWSMSSVSQRHVNQVDRSPQTS